MIQKREAETGKKTKKTWLLYALLSAVFASLTSILAKVGMQDVDSNLGTAIRTAVVLVMAWVVVFATGKQKTIHGIGKKNGVFLVLVRCGNRSVVALLFPCAANRTGKCRCAD